MNTPGVSLFQGADTLKVNSTLERQEEEEALQDQKRREAELGNLLENAFDDLDDDDEESTIDSTTNFTSNLLPAQPLPTLPTLSAQHQQQQQHHQQQNQQQHHQQQSQTEFVSASDMNRMKMLLESKSRELNNVNQLAKDAHKKIDDYQKHLSINQAELERALREKQHTHELLVDSKEKCSNLESNMEKLRHEKKCVEAENTQLVGQLETVQALLGEVQRKFDMVERDIHKRDDRNLELRLKQLEEQKRAQTELMQQQMNQVSDQLDKKKQELDQMHMRYNALQSSHETMLVHKSDQINELNAALDVAQRRCNQLAGRLDYEDEYKRQQQCIANLHGQVASMEQTIAELTERVNSTTAELDLMDTLLQQHQSESSESPNRLPSRLLGSTPLNPADRVGHIKQELYRALGNLKNKREEVRKLEKQLDERTNELQQLRIEENKILVQLATLKDQNSRLENRSKLLQEQLDERQHNSSLDMSKLQSEMNTLHAERSTLRQQLAEQNAEQQKMDKQLKQAKLDMAELQLSHDNIKRQNDQLNDENRQLRTRQTADSLRLELERHKILLKDAQSEVERLKKLYTDIANEKETLGYQLRKLSETDSIKELQEQRQQLAQLQRNVQLAEIKSQELTKILDTEKLRHERELQTLRDKCERQKHDEVLRATKETATNCSKCIDQLAEITKVEIHMLKLQNMNAAQANEFSALKNELEQSKELQLQLEAKVKQAAEQDKLLAQLKSTVQQYEEQLQQEAAKKAEHTRSIKQAASSSGAAVDDADDHVDGDAKVSPKSPEVTQEHIKRIEKRVRDEMAKLFAAELKRFTARVQQSEERSLCLHREYQLICRDLQKRQTEVELLKQTILAEREQMQQLLGDKDEKQKQMLQKCRNELQAKNERINALIKELEEQNASIEFERCSMKKVMAEWNKQKQSVEEVEQHWRAQLHALREAHEEAIRSAQKRYQSAKRTAHNYKLYADDKEAHMKREYDRIKLEYQTSIARIEATMQQHLQRKNRESQPQQQDQQKHKDSDKENESSNR